MAGDGLQPGEITLHGLVNLDNCCSVPRKPKSFIFNAIFPSSAETWDCIGSFRHYVDTDKDKKVNDMYDVQAKVCV